MFYDLSQMLGWIITKDFPIWLWLKRKEIFKLIFFSAVLLLISSVVHLLYGGFLCALCDLISKSHVWENAVCTSVGK